MVYLKEKEDIIMKMVNIIQENGKMIQSMEKEYYIIKMEINYMKEILKKVNLKVKE